MSGARVCTQFLRSLLATGGRFSNIFVNKHTELSTGNFRLDLTRRNVILLVVGKETPN